MIHWTVTSSYHKLQGYQQPGWEWMLLLQNAVRGPPSVTDLYAVATVTAQNPGDAANGQYRLFRAPMLSVGSLDFAGLIFTRSDTL